jgi:ribosomal protein L16 Arg81 hydroxylase
MPVSDFDLTSLLRPVEPEAFFRDTWEKEPLAILRKEPGYYRGLFSLHDIDEVIAFSRPKFYEKDFKQTGTPAFPFVQGWLPEEQPHRFERYADVAEVQQAFTRGKTVIITSMHHRWPAAATLSRNLEAFFGCPVHVNLYMTPKGAQGFNVHHDGHEVFVLQLVGSKHWRFYGPARELPLPDEDGPVSRERLGPPTKEVDVGPGDLLYMPRGHVHEAFTSDQLSVHFTVGVRVYRWVDLLRDALDVVSRREVGLRESLPPGLVPGGQTTPALDQRFKDLLRLLAESAGLEEALGRLSSTFLRSLAPLPANFFSATEDAEHIEPDTVVERAPGIICRVLQREDWVGIEFPGNFVDGPPAIGPALHFIARTPRFAVRDLPGDLAVDGKRILVGRLLRTRFLTRVSSPRPAPNRT